MQKLRRVDADLEIRSHSFICFISDQILLFNFGYFKVVPKGEGAWRRKDEG